jgi:O-antigen/teichoic acid export membrane protein
MTLLSERHRETSNQMNLKVQALKNVGSNWFGAISTILVGIFLSPFILHRLCDEVFGLWALIFSVSGYFGVFDFGVRTSIVKYVAEFEATGDRDRLNKIIDVSFATYTCNGLATPIVMGINSLYVRFLFHISPGYLHTAQVISGQLSRPQTYVDATADTQVALDNLARGLLAEAGYPWR